MEPANPLRACDIIFKKDNPIRLKSNPGRYFDSIQNPFILEMANKVGILFLACKQDLCALPHKKLQDILFRNLKRPLDEYDFSSECDRDITMIRLSPCERYLAVVFPTSVAVIYLPEFLVDDTPQTRASFEFDAQQECVHLEWPPLSDVFLKTPYFLTLDSTNKLRLHAVENDELLRNLDEDFLCGTLNYYLSSHVLLLTFSTDGKYIYGVDYDQKIVIMKAFSLEVVKKIEIPQTTENRILSLTHILQIFPNTIAIGSICRRPSDMICNARPIMHLISGNFFDARPEINTHSFELLVDRRFDIEQPPLFRFLFIRERGLLLYSHTHSSFVQTLQLEINGNFQELEPLDLAGATVRGFTLMKTAFSREEKSQMVSVLHNNLFYQIPAPPRILVLDSIGDLHQFRYYDTKYPLKEQSMLIDPMRLEDLSEVRIMPSIFIDQPDIIFPFSSQHDNAPQTTISAPEERKTLDERELRGHMGLSSRENTRMGSYALIIESDFNDIRGPRMEGEGEKPPLEPLMHLREKDRNENGRKPDNLIETDECRKKMNRRHRMMEDAGESCLYGNISNNYRENSSSIQPTIVPNSNRIDHRNHFQMSNMGPIDNSLISSFRKINDIKVCQTELVPLASAFENNRISLQTNNSETASNLLESSFSFAPQLARRNEVPPSKVGISQSVPKEEAKTMVQDNNTAVLQERQNIFNTAASKPDSDLVPIKQNLFGLFQTTLITPTMHDRILEKLEEKRNMFQLQPDRYLKAFEELDGLSKEIDKLSEETAKLVHEQEEIERRKNYLPKYREFTSSCEFTISILDGIVDEVGEEKDLFIADDLEDEDRIELMEITSSCVENMNVLAREVDIFERFMENQRKIITVMPGYNPRKIEYTPTDKKEMLRAKRRRNIICEDNKYSEEQKKEAGNRGQDRNSRYTNTLSKQEGKENRAINSQIFGDQAAIYNKNNKKILTENNSGGSNASKNEQIYRIKELFNLLFEDKCTALQEMKTKVITLQNLQLIQKQTQIFSKNFIPNIDNSISQSTGSASPIDFGLIEESKTNYLMSLLCDSEKSNCKSEADGVALKGKENIIGINACVKIKTPAVVEQVRQDHFNEKR